MAALLGNGDSRTLKPPRHSRAFLSVLLVDIYKQLEGGDLPFVRTARIEEAQHDYSDTTAGSSFPNKRMSHAEPIGP